MRQDVNIFAEPTAEHLPVLTCPDPISWVLRCGCGLTFSVGDRWTERRADGKPPLNRKIRTTADARHAHLIHFSERTRSQ